jgi:hypothetical protein
MVPVRVPARPQPYAGWVTARRPVSKKHQAAIRRSAAAVDRAETLHRKNIIAAYTDPDPAEKASIRELADFLGVAPNTVRKIISGK